MRPQGLTARLGTVGLIAGLVVAADLITKRWAAQEFPGDPRVIIDPILTFTYTENPGSAFSLFRNGGPILGVAAMVALAVVVASVWHPKPRGEVIAFGLVAGGALGNLADRVFRGDGFLDGRVIDWIQFPNFPVFNLADSSITVGVALLLVISWRHHD